VTRVVVLGDSQAEGLIPHLREPLRTIGWTPVEPWAYYRGADTRTLLRHLAPALAAAPDVVIVTAGGNDGLAEDSWLELARRTLATGAELVWMTPPGAREPGSDLDLARAATAAAIGRTLAGRAGVRVVDGRQLFAGLSHTDARHFTRASYAEAAGRLARALAPASSPGRAAGSSPAGALLALAGLAALVAVARAPGPLVPRGA